MTKLITNSNHGYLCLIITNQFQSFVIQGSYTLAAKFSIPYKIRLLDHSMTPSGHLG